MNFTREPIIETVITPREGCKLVVRSSKGVSQEDYCVDAVEVVSFGHSFFFRSQERPKSFLVPVSDYEILELKETRMVLKNVATERSIKIGGGREAPIRQREEAPQMEGDESKSAPQQQEGTRDRKRDRRRRGRRGRDRGQDMREPQGREEGRFRDDERPVDEAGVVPEALPAGSGGEERAPSFISKLFPPPQTLIKESLSRYKPAESSETAAQDESIFDHPKAPELPEEEEQ